MNGTGEHHFKKAKLVRLRRPKIACSPSYADYRPKTNAVILLDMGGMCILQKMNQILTIRL
jgi:hypothetical protein